VNLALTTVGTDLSKALNVRTTEPVHRLVIVSNNGQPKMGRFEPACVNRELDWVRILKFVNKHVIQFGKKSGLALKKKKLKRGEVD
jgi:hypothetical protein